MSGLAIIALALAVAWLAGLTLVLVLAIRQVGLLTLRLDQAQPIGGHPMAVGPYHDTANDGLALGTPLPDAVLATLPALATGTHYLLLLSSTCGPCRDLAGELTRGRFVAPRGMVALVPGPVELADGLAALLPPGIAVVRDPEAATLSRQELQLQSTPFAMQFDDGVVSGKAYLHSADELRRFIDSRTTSDAGEIAQRTNRTKEVASHVA